MGDPSHAAPAMYRVLVLLAVYVTYTRCDEKVNIPDRSEDTAARAVGWIGVCTPKYGYHYVDSSKPFDGTRTPPRYGFKLREDVATWEDCGTLCYEERGCTHWSWNYSNNVCHLNSMTHTDRVGMGGTHISGDYKCFISSG